MMIVKVFIVYKAIDAPFVDFSNEDVNQIKASDLPIYSVIVPLYREEKVVGQVIKAILDLDYPHDKLNVIITLEEYDIETATALHKLTLPKHINILTLPNTGPKTKPKALNVAFLATKGKYIVIFDAEIIPEKDQLKKAYLGFLRYPHIACFQTRLDHYNSNQNILTSLFNAEFSFYYDLFLPGLYQLHFPIPLSGHSIHFKRSVVESIGAWDPFNVAEDLDIGIRLSRSGYKTGILNSFSYEEATSDIRGWMMQRTRWMKGFIQTSIVHMRHPNRFRKEIGGWINFIAFFIIVPGTVLINIFNLFFLSTLVIWYVTGSKYIQLLFPGPIFYFALISFVVGNYIFTLLNLFGAYKRGRYEIVKYCLASPLYWILLSIATVRAIIQLILKPHYWEKTNHGININSTYDYSKGKQ